MTGGRKKLNLGAAGAQNARESVLLEAADSDPIYKVAEAP
jgi:hypothetical protein